VSGVVLPQFGISTLCLLYLPCVFSVPSLSCRHTVRLVVVHVRLVRVLCSDCLSVLCSAGWIDVECGLFYSWLMLQPAHCREFLSFLCEGQKTWLGILDRVAV
jgi:hypothetical protein